MIYVKCIHRHSSELAKNSRHSIQFPNACIGWAVEEVCNVCTCCDLLAIVVDVVIREYGECHVQRFHRFLMVDRRTEYGYTDSRNAYVTYGRTNDYAVYQLS